MTIGLIFGLVFFAVFIGGIVLCAVEMKKSKKTKSVSGKAKGFVSLGVSALAGILFLFIPFSFHTIQAGEVAVVKHLGEARMTRQAGTYFDFWITESYERYDAKVQTLDIRDNAYSKDAQSMDITMTLQYQIDSSKAVEIANTYGSLEALSSRIQSIAIERTKSILSSYSAMEIIETRATISPDVEKLIKETITDSYYVMVNAVVLTNIDFSDAFEATVEQKMIAEQQKIQAEYERETAIINAERDLEVAKLNADSKLYQAKQDAAAQVALAEAEARAIKEKSVEVARMLGFKIEEETIQTEEGEATEYNISFEGKTAEEIAVISEYLKYIEYLSKWNGELPDVVTGDSASIILPKP